jgi:hypothetical protein
MRESIGKFAIAKSDMPTSLMFIPNASSGPDSLKTRTEVLSNWRLRRRLSLPKLGLKNMGGMPEDKVAHPLRLDKITKVHGSY